MSESLTHDDLVQRAERWLKQQNCKVTIRDQCRIHTNNGEYPDGIGWRAGVSILIECKASRSDFLSDKRKPFRIDPSKGMGDWRFYLSPPEVIRPEDLPAGWGLLWATQKTIRKIHGVPPNSQWISRMPFTGDKISENMMLVSALRRLSLRGHLEQIYDGLPSVNKI